jgi:hypothetical protein
MGRDALQREEQGAVGSTSDRAIVCKACGHALTRRSARIEVSGRHRHTCVNPSGVVFTIGCFEVAPGCIPFGGRSDHFTWFAGHTWQIALCAACSAHVGWSYQGASSFHGLILDRISDEG